MSHAIHTGDGGAGGAAKRDDEDGGTDHVDQGEADSDETAAVLTARVRLGDIVVAVSAPARLHGFITDRFPLATDDGPADVVTRFRAGRPDAAGRPIGRRIGRDRDGAVWCHGAPGLPDLVVRVSDGTPPTVDVWQPRSTARRIYKRVVSGTTETQRLEAVTFYTLLYPALLIAERRGRFPLHAAAVARGRRVVAIGGLPGSGKSTLSAALLTRGWKLVSDNLVLLGQGSLWPFPEPLRLDQESLTLARVFDGDGVGAGGVAGVGVRKRSSTYARSAHPYDPAPGPYEVVALVVVEPGETTRLETGVDLSVEALLDLNRLALELDAYYTFRAWTRMALGDASGEAEAIGSALAGADFARLTVARGDVDGPMAAVDELLADRPGSPDG